MHAVTHLVARYHLPVLAIWMRLRDPGREGGHRDRTPVARAGSRAAIRELRLRWVAVALGALLAGLLLLAPPVPVAAPGCAILHGVGALLLACAPLAFAPLVALIARRAYPRMRVVRARWLWSG